MSRSNVILLVEDSSDDVELTLRTFRSVNLLNEIVVVRNGVEALDYLFGAGTYPSEEAKPSPELILLDLELPKIGGLALLRRLRAEEHTRRIPVIVLTSSSDERDMLASDDLGADGFIRKPLTLAQLITITKQLDVGWMVLNQTSLE
jgi:two-component system response regulator